MTRLNVTESADGVPRCDMRVEFRVGRDDLVKGLTYGLWLGLGNLVEKGPCGPAVDQVRRSQVYEWTRRSLHEHGEVGHLDAGNSASEDCRREAARRVDELFPEFKRHNQKGR